MVVASYVRFGVLFVCEYNEKKSNELWMLVLGYDVFTRSMYYKNIQVQLMTVSFDVVGPTMSIVEIHRSGVSFR